MFNIAIVEDEVTSAETLKVFFDRYSTENGVEFHISEYSNAVVFLSNYSSRFDIVCMDIEMPHINGMDAARKLREIDPHVVLIFTTNLSQYAIAGYEVDAISYILKPMKYSVFKFAVKKGISKCSEKEKNEIEIISGGTMMRLSVSLIRYVEIHDHNIVYHLEQGDYESYGTMKKVEQLMPPKRFYRCNSCYLVNLAHVKKIEGNNVWVGNEVLQISRPRRKDFLKVLHEYYAAQ